MPFADYKDFADCVAKNQDKDNPEAYCGFIKHQVEDSKSEGKYEIKDPRGDGAVLDDGGQPNIIDYSNQEPMLYQIGENSSHEYPGKIVITNESRYVDREVKRSNIPNVAATGKDATGSDKTLPTLPTGAPYELQKPSHNMHGMNFNTPIDWSKQEVVSIGKGLVARQIAGHEVPKSKEEVVDQSTYKEMKESLIKDDIKNFVGDALGEALNNLFDPPLSQAFSDTGNNPHIDQTKLGKPFDEKSDTGDDKTRTGPGGNQPRENYDSIHYQGQSDTKVHLATPYHDGKEPHDVSGIIPELQEDIKITIEDPKQDEHMPTIELIVKEPEFELKKKKDPEPGIELKNYPGRKDSDTHTNTIKAGDIDKNLQISELWKEKNDGIGIAGDEVPLTKSFSISEGIEDEREKEFLHASSFVGKVIYTPEFQTLEVVLNGKKYNFCNVPERTFDSFEGASSKGAFFARQIRQQFDCVSGLSESLNIYKHRQPGEFDWINDEAIENMKSFTKENPDGRFILAVVSGESYTDHRIEGEDFRRHWTKNELIQNIRTAKHKLTDINHMWQKKDPMSGMIYDANWNFTNDRGEMILWESDPDILNAIRNDIITAASINTGKPRENEKNCSTGECFTEATGTVLGEDNNVALAYIVTDPQGFKYNGQVIPAMPPGMKFTKLYIIE